MVLPRGGGPEMEECLKALTDFMLAKPCCTFRDTLNPHKPDCCLKQLSCLLPVKLLVLTFFLLPLPKLLFPNLGQFS